MYDSGNTYNIISLGHACQVKENINKYYKNPNNRETQIFDWLVTDFKTVLRMLHELINPTELLQRENFTTNNVNMNCGSWVDGFSKIEHISMKLISVHDFPLTSTFDDTVETFIETLHRRLDRLRGLIASNNTIHFIHMLDHQFTKCYIPTQKDINDLFDIINKINSSSKCYLHILIPPKYKNITMEKLHDNAYIHHMDDSNPNNEKIDWRNYNYDWETIFKKIDIIDSLQCSSNI